MRARARFHDFLKRLFGRVAEQDKLSAPTEAILEPSRKPPPTPLFSLGEDKQELVASYRNLESEGV